VIRSVEPALVDELPTDGFGRVDSGNDVGVLLHVIDGYMAELEFYSLHCQRGWWQRSRAALLLGGHTGVKADGHPARIGELAVPAQIWADRGAFGLDNAAGARDLREDAF
jgi:hypothetical protein